MKDFNESSIEFTTGQGVELEGRLVRLECFTIVFDVFSQDDVLRTSEVLSKFKIVNSRSVFYEGQAVFNQWSRTAVHRKEMVKEATQFKPRLTARGCGKGSRSFAAERMGRIHG